jgi:hypothetical protein
MSWSTGCRFVLCPSSSVVADLVGPADLPDLYEAGVEEDIDVCHG